MNERFWFDESIFCYSSKIFNNYLDFELRLLFIYWILYAPDEIFFNKNQKIRMISLSGGQVLYRNTEVYEVDAKRELIKIISSIKLLQRITSHNSCVRSTSLGLRHIAAKGRRNVSYASRYTP